MQNISNDLRILVTGGYGFIGGNLIQRLNDLGIKNIFNLDKVTYASSFNYLANKNTNLVIKNLEFDLCSKEDVKDAFRIANPDLVFHLAAETHVDRSIDSSVNFLKTNVIGTFNLLEEARSFWNKLQRDKKNKFKIIHISTDEVYGDVDYDKTANEDYPYKPNSPYSATKASSDHLMRAWNKTYNLPIIITHCSNNYGPWQFPDKLIPKVINNALKNKKIPIYGKGENIRDWIYVRDHVNALIRCATLGNVGERYCISSNQEFSNLEIVEKVLSIMEIYKPSKIGYKNLLINVNDRPGHDFRYSMDSTKIKSQLNWEPKMDLNNGIRHTIKWYIDNLDWLEEINKKVYSGKRLGILNLNK
tara:strand:+ start:19055 stop:20134 length:1080 start_codon:yes stop_codon:yes gene_type:complete